jgi:nucleotide-binding universal stress UspA family protein
MKEFIKNILWATDFSPEGQEALAYAETFAKAFGAEITALHVTPDFSLALYNEYPAIIQELIRRTEQIKQDAMAQLEDAGKKRGVKFKKMLVAAGAPAKNILETAEAEKSDLIVMGKTGQSLMGELLVGSVANHVLRHSHVPVLVTKKSKHMRQIGKILVPTDFAKKEDVEREYAWKVAKGLSASLTFLYVLELHGHEFRLVDEMFKSVLAKFKRKATLDGQGITVDQDVTRAITAVHGIVEYAEERHYDLIVMETCVGALGRLILGSTTEKVIAYADLPVFAIPPKLCA